MVLADPDEVLLGEEGPQLEATPLGLDLVHETRNAAGLGTQALAIEGGDQEVEDLGGLGEGEGKEGPSPRRGRRR